MTSGAPIRTLALIVEDDRPVRTFITATLGAHGFDTLVAETGTDGVALAYRRVPDVILLDMGLPDIDGMEVLNRIRVGAGCPNHCCVGPRQRASEGVRPGCWSGRLSEQAFWNR